MENEKQETRKAKEEEEIVVAGGCFWGTEHFLKQIPGVLSTQVGYVNSLVPNPNYQQVCSGETHAAEGVKVVYDIAKVDLLFLLNLYFLTIDPTSLNRQGGDRGTQYRTGIYFTTPMQKAEAETAIANLEHDLGQRAAIEVKPLENFYPAEEYHQDYLDKNPGGYCHIAPQLFEIARRAQRYSRPSDDSLRLKLTPTQWKVTQHAATEQPFTGQYYKEHRPGIYVDVVTGEPLFVSSDKFDSGCGWPSFSQPITPEALGMRNDNSHGMQRVEVFSRQGRSHLGHVFNDGPKDRGGLRYCINSASLRFIPLDEMKKEGYAKYVPYVR